MCASLCEIPTVHKKLPISARVVRQITLGTSSYTSTHGVVITEEKILTNVRHFRTSAITPAVITVSLLANLYIRSTRAKRPKRMAVT